MSDYICVSILMKKFFIWCKCICIYSYGAFFIDENYPKWFFYLVLTYMHLFLRCFFIDKNC